MKSSKSLSAYVIIIALTFAFLLFLRITCWIDKSCETEFSPSPVVTATASPTDEPTTRPTIEPIPTDDGSENMPIGNVGAGRTIALMTGCLGCHATEADSPIIVGPSWLNLYGSEVLLDDDSVIIVDEAYLRESIMNPNAKVVDGFVASIMPPTYGDALSEDDINNILVLTESVVEGEKRRY